MRRLLILFLLIAATPAAVHAQMMPERLRLLMSSRYVELEKLGERETQGDPRPNSAKLMPLCVAYAKLKRYNKVFPCTDRLEANVKAGDTAMQDMEEMGRNSPLLAGLARMGAAMMGGGEDMLKGTVVPFLHLIRAEVYTELRDYEKAIAASNEAVKAVPQRWNEERMFRIHALSALGIAHAHAGNRGEALKAAEALEEIGTSYPFGALKQPKWLGVVRIHAALGNFRKAHEVFTRENPTSHGLFMSVAYGVGGAVAGLGEGESFTAWTDLPLEFMKYKTQLEVGEIPEAKKGFDKMLTSPAVSQNGEIYWLLLYDRGRVAAHEGDLPAAIEFWRRAIEVIEEQRSTINTEASKIGFVGDKQAVYRALVAGLFAQQKNIEAFDYVERSKARALVDLLAGKKDFAVAAPNAEEIRKLLSGADAAEEEARVQGALAAQSGRRSADVRLEVKALREQAPDLASLVSVSSTPLAEIQSRIPEDEALVEYYYDDNALYAFVISREGLQAAKLDSGGLEADVRMLRKAVELPAGDGHDALSRRLHARLIAPLPGLSGKQKLLIVAHGILHYLPFAALRDDAGYLIDRYSLRFLPSASVIRYLRRGGSQEQAGVLAFGNPDLGDPKLDLKFAQEEAVEIARKVPQSRALLRKEATESAFRQYAGGFGYLHFATHGEFNADAPLKSALMLARDERSDGLLTVDKLYSTRLGAELVTLSACETGLGKIANGDDVVGLTRGFLYAGAATVVASLWKVDDQATAALMTRFYDELKAGDKRAALRAAQLATREKFPHPFFWAAFQLTGDAL